VLEILNTELTTIYAATAGIAQDPTPPPAPAPATTSQSAPLRGHDPLRALDPAHYVSVLTGHAVGRSRKVLCPLHEDRTPSLHVYDDGWYCFGCNRHGHSAYDLAAAVWNLHTRGPDFLELRARLYELFLPGQTPPAPPRAAGANAPSRASPRRPARRAASSEPR
jgi:CHC2 zinc finger